LRLPTNLEIPRTHFVPLSTRPLLACTEMKSHLVVSWHVDPEPGLPCRYSQCCSRRGRRRGSKSDSMLSGRFGSVIRPLLNDRYPRRVVTESRPVMWRRYPRLLRSLYRHVPPAGPWTFNRHTAHRGAVARVEQAFRKTRACAPWRIALPRLGASGPTAVAGYLMPSASGRKLHVTHDYRGVTQSILHAAPSCRVAVPQTIAAQYVIVACRVGIPSALVIHAPRLSS
jgi:hypothetical protein